MQGSRLYTRKWQREDNIQTWGQIARADRSLGVGTQEEQTEVRKGGTDLKSYEGAECNASFLGVPLFLITLLKS